MLKIHFTSALKRFYPDLKTISVEASDIPSALDQCEAHYPGIKSFLLEDDGQLRKHVNVFVGEELASLESDVKPQDKIYIFQALSGG